MSYNIAKLSDVNPPLVTDLKNRCYPIIGLCQQVHREMGPYLNVFVKPKEQSETCFDYALARKGA